MKVTQIRKSVLFPIISLTALLQFCAPAANKNSSSSAYYEDLSIYRESAVPESKDTVLVNDDNVIEQEVTTDFTQANDITKELDIVTNLIIESKKDIQYVDGFTIQIYSGNNRDQANSIKQRTYDLSISQTPKVSYEQPNYKVRIGKYYTRIEANEDYNLLKEVFSRAVLIPSKIKIEE